MTVATTGTGQVIPLPSIPSNQFPFLPVAKLYCYGTATGDGSGGHIQIAHRWQATQFELNNDIVVITDIFYSSDQALDDVAYSYIADTMLDKYDSAKITLLRSTLETHNTMNIQTTRISKPLILGKPYTRTTNWDITHVFETNTNTKLYYVTLYGYLFRAEPMPFLNM